MPVFVYSRANFSFGPCSHCLSFTENFKVVESIFSLLCNCFFIFPKVTLYHPGRAVGTDLRPIVLL